MAAARSASRFGSSSFICSRCSTILRTTSQATEKRRTPALATQQVRGMSSGHTSLSPRNSYGAISWASRRHDAASGLLLHPRSTRRVATSTTTSYNASLLRRSARSQNYSSSSTADAAATPAQSERPEPPDYLDEKERAIFDRLNKELEPVELQVRDAFSSVLDYFLPFHHTEYSAFEARIS